MGGGGGGGGGGGAAGRAYSFSSSAVCSRINRSQDSKVRPTLFRRRVWFHYLFVDFAVS